MTRGNGWLDVVAVATVVGAGLVAGLFVAFSVSVMPALSRLPAPRAAVVMQQVNRAILNPVFGLLFGGTAVLAVVVAATTGITGTPLRLAGALVLLAGVYAVTAAVNVPLNNALDRVDPGGPEIIPAWERFAGRWTRWNHVRALTSTVATVLLVVG
ncbi:MAG: hypothetical protein ABT15_29855 [Pseudonocardia sp. SCN 73-27]|uniref:anthrone oxygenase family protein n=1 Tax=unclassified Pseudonocardia TaxID=2619320 RepID=UPI0008695E77|nr:MULTISPECIES: anthrone oxygenase family protein [unclassified Pseudonocardia]ODV00239.1 MAG: hypothetical protein ABT15_29855 [Pseudonocardia sp. SCN 73-27]